MTAILISGVVGLVGTLLGTPLLIRYLHAKEYGQFIRQDGPQGHFTKRGTPTMGGLVIIISTVLGYTLANLSQLRTPRASGVLLLFLVVGLGLIGFLDDFEEISKQRSLGPRAWQKIVGQALIGVGFSVAALHFADRNGLTPASTRISFARRLGDRPGLRRWRGSGLILFILWANFLITAWSNAVNLTDGLDGLAAGSLGDGLRCLHPHRRVADEPVVHLPPLDHRPHHLLPDPRPARPGHDRRRPHGGLLRLPVVERLTGQDFMGDTGSLALGGAVAGLSILTRTEFLAVILGGLFLAEVMSDIIQIVSFKSTGRRVFRMAPLHHHFELGGWTEVNVVIRFWIIAGLCVIAGLGLFYAGAPAPAHLRMSQDDRAARPDPLKQSSPAGSPVRRSEEPGA